MPFFTEFRPLSEVTLHVAEAGPQHGPVTILLHGFPEFWWGWRSQIEILARAGLRVIVPDQRGYNLSSKPVGTAAYMLDILAKDIVELADGPAKLQTPTLILWGRKDAFLQPGLAEATLQRFEDARLIWFETAGHWVHHEEPHAVAEAIIEFLL